MSFTVCCPTNVQTNVQTCHTVRANRGILVNSKFLHHISWTAMYYPFTLYAIISVRVGENRFPPVLARFQWKFYTGGRRWQERNKKRLL